MSDQTKLNLWQKLKRLLTTSAPQAIVDGADQPNDLLTLSVAATNNTTDLNSSKNNSSHKNADPAEITPSNEQDTKTSLTKTATASATPIVDYLKNYFGNKHWHYTHYRPRAADRQQSHNISLHMRSKNLDCGYLFRVQEKNALLALYGILPFLIPESHQSAAMLLTTQINYDMLIGNLELDINDGEIRYKNAIDIEVVGIDDAIIEHLLQSVVAMTTVAYEIFDDLINTPDPSEDMATLLGELRQRADARTFFLATPKKQ